jgi:hypothetical protein
MITLSVLRSSTNIWKTMKKICSNARTKRRIIDTGISSSSSSPCLWYSVSLSHWKYTSFILFRRLWYARMLLICLCAEEEKNQVKNNNMVENTKIISFGCNEIFVVVCCT